MDGHPSEEALSSFAWGGTAVGVDLAIHIAECARCREIVARATAKTPVTEGDIIASKYRIEKMLASGGIGAVVRALDIKLERHVAIKFLLPYAANDERLRARFELEARVAGKMQSEHVARVLDTGDLPNGAQYIVLEYLEGEDLTAVLQRVGALDVETAVGYVVQACEAMAEAHGLGIVHRDLKPANLFLTKRADGSSCVKVIDFGIAKTINYGRQGAQAQAQALSLTQGGILGTPRYMSPEQVNAPHAIDERTDVWGLGIILYELVTKHAPFEGEPDEAGFPQAFRDVPPPTKWRPALPAAFDSIVRKALALDPKDRYQSVGELAQALAPFAPADARIATMRRQKKASTSARTVPRAAMRKAVWPFFLMGALAIATLAFVVAIKLGHRKHVPLGSPCTNGCGDLACVDGACTKRCTTQSDCPTGTKCTSDSVCSVPLRVGFIYVGVVEDEGWTKTHDIGRRYAMSKLPYLETDYTINTYKPDDADRAIDELVKKGMSVIVGNSSSLAQAIAKKAQQYPDVRFLLTASTAPDPRVGAINARLYEAWYLAGFAAAQKSKTHRLGFVGALVTPEVVRNINAFARGARLFDPKAVVEVRWLGFWFDTGKPDEKGHYKEEQLALELLASGCDVIAHHADNERVVSTIEDAKAGAFSIGNNNIDACSKGPKTCLGVPYWNWGPLYVENLDAIHRGTWKPGSSGWAAIQANPEASTVNFKLHEEVAGSKIAIETASLLAELAKPDGGRKIFTGPYCSTGQRVKCVAEGEALSDDDLQTMCWFVEGVIDGDGSPARVPPTCLENR